MSRLFPELDVEPGPPRQESAHAKSPGVGSPNPTRAATETNRRAPIALPPPDSRVSALEALLGLPGPFAGRGGCHVEAAEVTDGGHSIRLTVRTRGGAAVVCISDDPTARAFAHTAHLSLSYRETSNPPWLLALLRHVAGRLEHVRFATVHDAASDVASARTPEERSVVFGYATSASWRTFFETREQYRSYCGDLGSDVIWVHHADLECQASTPDSGGDTFTFFNQLPSTPRTSHRTGIEAVTDVRDVDVIKGGDARLERILEAAVPRGDEHRAVVLSSTCISLVTGDDVEGAAERMRKRVRIPVLNLNNVNNPAAEMFRLARREPGFFDAPKRAGAVNLIGLPRAPGRDDLVSLLASAGVEVNCLLLPDIDAAQIARYMAAELQVIYPCAWQALAYPAILEGIPIPAITPPAPYGVEGTRRWLEAILDATGRNDAFESAWKQAWEPHREEWERLTREARDYQIGFVVDDELIDRLREPELLLGVPLVAMLREMGLRVELLIYGVRPPGAPETGPDGAPRGWFTTPDELADRITSSESAAFYSEMYFDPRLTRSGKGIVSLRDVALGITGAVSTLRRIVTLCRTPFYRTYSRYLGTPFRGARTRDHA